MRFSTKDFFRKYDQIHQETADLVTFTEEILTAKLHFFVQCFINWNSIETKTVYLQSRSFYGTNFCGIFIFLFWSQIVKLNPAKIFEIGPIARTFSANLIFSRFFVCLLLSQLSSCTVSTDKWFCHTSLETCFL